MKALQVYRTYFPDPPGGLQEVIRQIGLGASESGVNTRIFTLSPNPEPSRLQLPEGDVIRSRETIEIASCNISLTCYSEFRRQVEWADIVHYHFPWPFQDALHFMAGVKKPTVLTYHSDIVRQKGWLKLYSPLMKWFLGSMNAIVATSENYVTSSSLLGQFREKVSVIPIGISDKGYLEKEIDSGLIDLPDEFHQDGFFLFVGMLRYYKGLQYLLDALAGTNIKCVIVGTGPEEQALKEQARRLNLNNLFFTGYVDDAVKSAYLAACKGIVFPSHLRSEAYGVTLLEGALFGKPLISCEIGTGTSYVNSHEESGLVIPPEDPLALRSAMQRLYNDPEYREVLGKGARRRYEQLFTGEVMGKKYASLYRKVLDSGV